MASIGRFEVPHELMFIALMPVAAVFCSWEPVFWVPWLNKGAVFSRRVREQILVSGLTRPSSEERRLWLCGQ